MTIRSMLRILLAALALLLVLAAVAGAYLLLSLALEDAAVSLVLRWVLGVLLGLAAADVVALAALMATQQLLDE